MNEVAQDEFHGSDQGAVVGVSDVPCSNASGCSGHVCGRITKSNVTTGSPTETVTFMVDCRGAVGRFVWVSLPQTKQARANELGVGTTQAFIERSLNATFFVAHEMVTAPDTLADQTILPYTTVTSVTSSQACEFICFTGASAACRSWRWLNTSSECLLFSEDIPFDYADATINVTSGQTCNSDDAGVYQQYYNPPFVVSWPPYIRNFAAPVCVTRAPTMQPTHDEISHDEISHDQEPHPQADASHRKAHQKMKFHRLPIDEYEYDDEDRRSMTEKS
jgi:hypothetical protein